MIQAFIIIPCYNEASRLDSEAFIKFQNQTSPFKLCFVNDGSSDSTASVLKTIAKTAKHIQVINLDKNVGKAEAIRHAVLGCDTNYEYVGYLDADLSTPLNELERLLNVTKNQNKKMVLGSRLKILGASIKRRLHRHLFGRIIATFIDSFILKLDIYDTQCGAKIIEKDLASRLFKDSFKTKWLFDVELLARAKKQHGKSFCKAQILEVPLQQWHDAGDSKITFSDVLKTPFQLLRIYNHYR